MIKLMKQTHFVVKGIVLLIISVYLFSGHVNAQGVDEESFCRLLLQLSKEGTIYNVNQDGTGDFTSIVEGVEAVGSNDTLLIFPGIYEESINIQNKTVNLIGIDRDSCIIMSDSTSYHTIPLNIGAGRIQNLTVYGTKTKTNNNKKKESYIEGDFDSIYEWQKAYPGYAIHADQEYGYGKDLHIENCRILSNNNQCLGIGSRAFNNISVINCELVSNGSGGCIYFHNSVNEYIPGKATFLLKDCDLKNFNCPYVIAIHSVGDTNPVDITFQNNKISTVAYEGKGEYEGNDSNNWFDLTYFDDPKFIDELSQAGYTSSYTGKLLNKLSYEQSRRFIINLIPNSSFLKEIPEISEGITYLKIIDHSDYYTDRENRPDVKKRVRHTMQAYNMPGCTKNDGWCGLSSIYLTEDSYGNTLMEMNYPKVALLPDEE